MASTPVALDGTAVQIELERSPGQDKAQDAEAALENAESSNDTAAIHSLDSQLLNEQVEKLHELLQGMDESLPESESRQDALQKMVESLSEAQINAPNSESQTALHIVARQGLVQIAECLLMNKASVNAKDSKGQQPLHYACEHGNIQVVELLLDQKGVDILAIDNDKRSPLYLASYFGHASIVERVLSRQRNDNHESVSGSYQFTDLHTAAYFGDEHDVKTLLGERSSVLVTDTEGWTPLRMAISGQYADIIDMLLEKERAQVDICDNEGCTPLMVAIRGQYDQGVEKLLDFDANCNFRSLAGDSCLHWAVWRFSKKIFSNVIEQRGIDVDVLDKQGKTALHYLCGARNEETGQSFSGAEDAGISGYESEEKSTHDDSDKDNIELEALDKLLQKSDKPLLKTPSGETALHLAVKNRGAKFIRRLLSSKHQEAFGKEMVADAGERLLLEDVFRKTTPDDLGFLARICRLPVVFQKALFWAAAALDRHDFAKMVLEADSLGNRNLPEGCCAIEWAAHLDMPEILWCLIATSPRNKATQSQVTEALRRWRKTHSVAKKGAKGQRNSTRENVGKAENKRIENEERRKPMHMGPSKEKDVSKNTTIVFDILRDPPTAQVYRDSVTLKRPVPRNLESKAERLFNSHISRFYRGNTFFSAIRRDRLVEAAVYNSGPKALMKNAGDDLKETLKSVFGDTEAGLIPTESKDMFEEKKLRFTWIHLPVTNIDWMKDLLQTIMYDEGHNADDFHRVSSFLRDTWFEIPDRTSASRIMRPQFIRRNRNGFTHRTEEASLNTSTRGEGGAAEREQHNEEARHREALSEEKKKKKRKKKKERREPERNEKKSGMESKVEGEQGDNFLAASALYMPFLSISTHCPQDLDKESIGDATNHLERFRNPRSKLATLKGKRNHPIIHESATLDESYYHFAEDDESQKDRQTRNSEQVVAKWSRKQNSNEDDSDTAISRTGTGQIKMKQKSDIQPDFWPILRVNQIWIWTLADKWLISATSPQSDENEQLWVDGFIEWMNIRADDGGVQSQPNSTDEMMKAIVDYCIGSYERPPSKESFTKHEAAGDHSNSWRSDKSIRQIFSNYINSIGRNETRLFADFANDTSVERGSNKHADDHVNKIKRTIKQEVTVFDEIKDIRDELNILKSIAGYQKIVQAKVFEETSLASDLSATYILNDLDEMDKLAERIQSSVSATLSLQESEIANFQAEESMRQGRAILIFTIATIFFLPMSFLSSVFALDAEASLQTPGWIYAVILSSMLPFMLLTYYATRADIHKYFRRVFADSRESVEQVWLNKKADVKDHIEKDGHDEQPPKEMKRFGYVRWPGENLRRRFRSHDEEKAQQDQPGQPAEASKGIQTASD